MERVVSAHAKTHGSASQTSSGADKSRVDNSKAADNIMATQNDMLATVTKLLQQTDDVRTQMLLSCNYDFDVVQWHTISLCTVSWWGRA